MKRSIALALSLSAFSAVAHAQGTYVQPAPEVGPPSPEQAMASAQEVAEANAHAQMQTVRAADAERRAEVATQAAQAAQAQAAQAIAVANSKEVQTVLASLRESKGNIDAATQALADRMIQERAAKLAGRAFWTRGAKVEGNTVNLALHLRGGGRVGGEWGPTSRTDFGLRLDALPWNIRLWAEGGASVQAGFTGPKEAVCGADGASDRCFKPGKDGAVDWGMGSVFGRAAAGGSYQIANLFRVGLGWEGVFTSFAYTARGESQTTRETVVQHGFRLDAETTLFGVPMGVSLSVVPATYVSPSGERFGATQTFLSVSMAPWIW